MKAHPLLSFNASGDLLTDADLIMDAKQVRNITADADNRFFRSIPEGTQKDIKEACIIGNRGSGKTTTMNYRLYTAYKTYGKENVNAVYCDDPRIFLNELDDRPVQYGIIDDATSHASSREIHKQTELLKALNKIRHIFTDRRKDGGLLLIDKAWQRWIELDPGLRTGNLLLYKTGMVGKNDRSDIIDKVGESYIRVLDQITDRIDLNDNSVKSIAVGRITAKRPEDGGVGIYTIPNTPNILPKILESEDYFGVTEDNMDILKKYRNDPKWSKRIECYELYLTGEYTQQEIASILDLKRQGYVSASVTKVKELLSKS